MRQGGQLVQAIQFYNRAIELDGRLTMAFFNRGLIRVRRSEYELARSDWQAAYVNDPKNHSSGDGTVSPKQLSSLRHGASTAERPLGNDQLSVYVAVRDLEPVPIR
jgi:hypothetical protein